MASNTVQFAAIVKDDAGQRGVSWMLTCNSSQVADCGSISRHTASGSPTTYIAPVTTPPGGSVTIVANSSAAPAQSVTTTIQITPIVYGPISIAFAQPVTATMATSSQAIFTAVVTNDHLDSHGNPMGYTLKLTCAVAGTCGGISGSTYTAPAAVPAGGTVTITATSVADTTQSVSTTVSIVPAPVVITLTPPASSSIAAGAAVNFSAKVTGDPAQLGVDWSLACTGGPCGSLVVSHTASNQVTSYAAPASLPTAGTVTVTATSTADPTKQASATLTVAAAALRNDLLQGQYAFLMNGVNLSFPTGLAGSLVADGEGHITSAEEAFPGQSQVVTGISGSYFIAEDGRGLITLSGLPAYTSWLNGQQVFAVTVIDPDHAVIEEFDGVGTYAFQSGSSNWLITAHGNTMSGTLERQNTAQFGVVPSGSFSFAWNTTSLSAYAAAYYGGVLDVDTQGYLTDFTMDRYIGDTIGSISAGSYGVQSFAAMDNFGHGTVKIGPYTFNYFLVDAGHLMVLASLSGDSSGLPAGHIFARPAAPATLEGNYVFTLAGSTPIYATNGKPAGSLPQVVGGRFACEGAGALSGYLDTNNNGVTQSAAVTGLFTPSGGCTAAANGRAVLTLSGAGASRFAAYPTVQHGVLLMQLDSRKSGIGVALGQTNPNAPLQGAFAVSGQQSSFLDSTRASSLGAYVGAWTNFTGQVVGEGASGLTGKLDLDQLNGTFFGLGGDLWTLSRAVPVTGELSGGVSGRYTGTLSADPFLTLTTPASKWMVFYVVDDSTVLFLEQDSVTAVGSLQAQSF
ncbi:MAG: hypothetical protein JST79_09355 [Acidobacteria bacterium]|nr:hypothetical protein [Acidobacteriota bacterium]